MIKVVVELSWEKIASQQKPWVGFPVEEWDPWIVSGLWSRFDWWIRWIPQRLYIYSPNLIKISISKKCLPGTVPISWFDCVDPLPPDCWLGSTSEPANEGLAWDVTSHLVVTLAFWGGEILALMLQKSGINSTSWGWFFVYPITVTGLFTQVVNQISSINSR